MRHKSVFLAMFATLIISYPSFSGQNKSKQDYEPVTFMIDRQHSSIKFSIPYLKIMKISGRADDYFGTIIYDKADITRSSVEIVIRAASLNTAMAVMTSDLHSSFWLDVDQFPSMTFKSTRIEKHSDRYVAIGPFKMHGVTKEIEMPFSIVEDPAEATKRQRLIVAMGPVTVNRTEYGIAKVSSRLGQEVEIEALLLLKPERPQSREMKQKYQAIAMKESDLVKFIGIYQAPGRVRHIELLAGRLTFQYRDMGIIRPMVPIGKNEFLIIYSRVGEVMRVAFEMDDDKVIKVINNEEPIEKITTPEDRWRELQWVLNYEAFTARILTKGIDSAVMLYHDFKEESSTIFSSFDENVMNNLGYKFLGEERLKEAIEVFKLNVEEYPESSNVYDSLGEAYMKNGDKELAIKNYKKTLELNPDNKNALEMLRKLSES